MAKLSYQSPLAGTVETLGIVGLTLPGLRIVEKPRQGMLELRGEAARPEFLAAVEDVLGVGLPLSPLDSVKSVELRVLWSRPDGWLICGAPELIRDREQVLRAALEGMHYGLFDVGARALGFELSGPLSRDLLSKGTTLDLHAKAFPPGRAARTVLAGQGALIHATRDEPGYDLYVDVSMAAFIWAWLQDAAVEFQPTAGT